jgi:hypothetical protein
MICLFIRLPPSTEKRLLWDDTDLHRYYIQKDCQFMSFPLQDEKFPEAMEDMTSLRWLKLNNANMK